MSEPGPKRQCTGEFGGQRWYREGSYHPETGTDGLQEVAHPGCSTFRPNGSGTFDGAARSNPQGTDRSANVQESAPAVPQSNVPAIFVSPAPAPIFSPPRSAAQNDSQGLNIPARVTRSRSANASSNLPATPVSATSSVDTVGPIPIPVRVEGDISTYAEFRQAFPATEVRGITDIQWRILRFITDLSSVGIDEEDTTRDFMPDRRNSPSDARRKHELRRKPAMAAFEELASAVSGNAREMVEAHLADLRRRNNLSKAKQRHKDAARLQAEANMAAEARGEMATTDAQNVEGEENSDDGPEDIFGPDYHPTATITPNEGENDETTSQFGDDVFGPDHGESAI